MTENTTELIFPLTCHFRIIAVESPGVLDSLLQVVRSFDYQDDLTRANNSASGKYASYAVSLRVEDRGAMQRIEQALAAVPGVRMVL